MPTPSRVSEPARCDHATRTWLVLVALTLASAMASGYSTNPMHRLSAALAVAALCAAKARALVSGYLVPREAGPVFDRIVWAFSMLVPIFLTISALIEAWRSTGP